MERGMDDAYAAAQFPLLIQAIRNNGLLVVGLGMQRAEEG